MKFHVIHIVEAYWITSLSVYKANWLVSTVLQEREKWFYEFYAFLHMKVPHTYLLKSEKKISNFYKFTVFYVFPVKINSILILTGLNLLYLVSERRGYVT